MFSIQKVGFGIACVCNMVTIKNIQMRSAMSHLDIDRQTKFYEVRLEGVSLLGEVVANVDASTLLHAGPPFVDSMIPAAVRNAAIHALMFERLAKTPEEAAALIDQGKVRFQPAQDWGVVTPLAQVVSASMPVFVFGNGDHRAFAPIVEGAPIGLRFGSREPECLDNLALHARFAECELKPLLAKSPVDLASVIGKALDEGNECHSLTDRANAALLEQLPGLSDQYRTLLENSPGFVLPVIMGACGWVLQFSPSSEPTGHQVVAAGGNGVDFGLRLQGQTRWTTIPTQAPEGKRFPNQENRPVLGAIGDSAVIDFCGLGGQALACAPALASDWQALLPDDWKSRPDTILDPETGVVSPSRVLDQQKPPIINLALVSADAMGGILGKGFYQPGLSVFEAAMLGIAS
ncbi:MAG: DUF1116 domain-containing protein [Pseudomonadota bacterium]|nr:DUF1116 domain-containing protein [Pseudomonadota bacterium]